jgi:hypothetical protein
MMEPPSVSVFVNYAGTMANQFQIGRLGTTILQGETDPDNTLGNNGDIYVKKTTSASLFIKMDGSWMRMSDPRFYFSRETVKIGQSITVGMNTTYVGVTTDPDRTNEVITDPTNIYLPTGVTGKKITIKDESGLVPDSNIFIYPKVGSTDLIENYDQVDIQKNYGSLTLIYDDQWYIIGNY